MLYLTGDTHGENLGRFSYARNPFLRTLTSEDVVAVLGDTALMWPGCERETSYTMRELSRKPFAIVFVLGNHDNYDWAETLPVVNAFGGRMRQMVVDGTTYENRYVVDSWTVADLCGRHCLLCAHAKSHDIDHLYQPDDKRGMAAARRRGEWFRVAHRTWWPQEALDVSRIEPFVQEHEEEHFDAILTHDCPGCFFRVAPHAGDALRLEPTEQEGYFDSWVRELDYDVWAHGHMHHETLRYEESGKTHWCLYHDICPIDLLAGR